MSDSEEERTIRDPNVALKYKQAGEIATVVARKLFEKIIKGASVRQICIDGEELITEELKNICKKDKQLKKGIAFPVCICVNNCINHFSPLFSDDDVILENGDVAKLDLGVHVDGFVATLAYSVVVGASAKNPVDGPKADAILAAQYALRAAVRMLKPGNTNYAITDTVVKVAESYKCVPVRGMLSFQLQEGNIEGEKTIVQNPSEGQRKEIEKCTFAANEVYAIDSIISTGSGKGREMESRTTIYKKSEETYKLKLKTSKEFFSKVYKDHDTFPFNLRNFEDEKRARMGVQECVSHKLVDPYPVLFEKPNEIVGQFKTTVLVTSKNIANITSLDFDDVLYKSEHKIEDVDIQKLIEQYDNPKKKTKKKKPTTTNNGELDKSEGNPDKTKAKSDESSKSTEKKDKNLKSSESQVKSTDKAKAADQTKPNDSKTNSVDKKGKSAENKTKSTENKPKSTENKAKSTENKAKSTENKAKSTENKTKATENKTKTSENKTKTSENKTKSTDSKANSTDSKTKSTDIKAKSTDIKAKSTDIKAKSTDDSKAKSTDSKAKSTDIKEKSTDIKEKSTDIKEKSTDIKEKSTDIKEKSTDIKEKSTDIKEKSTDSKEKSTDSKAKSTDKESNLDENETKSTVNNIKADTVADKTTKQGEN